MDKFYTVPSLFAFGGLLGLFVERQENHHVLTFVFFGAAAFSLVVNFLIWRVVKRDRKQMAEERAEVSELIRVDAERMERLRLELEAGDVLTRRGDDE